MDTKYVKNAVLRRMGAMRGVKVAEPADILTEEFGSVKMWWAGVCTEMGKYADDAIQKGLSVVVVLNDDFDAEIFCSRDVMFSVWLYGQATIRNQKSSVSSTYGNLQPLTYSPDGRQAIDWDVNAINAQLQQNPSYLVGSIVSYKWNIASDEDWISNGIIPHPVNISNFGKDVGDIFGTYARAILGYLDGVQQDRSGEPASLLRTLVG